MRIFCAGMVTETNGFVSRPTTLEDFSGKMFEGFPGKSPEHTLSFATKTWELLAQERGYDFIHGLLAGAMPGGPTSKSAYETMRDILLKQLCEATPVDAVLLDLHGAMMADGYPDVEGDIIENVRKIVGPKVPIGVHLDLHCHLSQKMLDNSTIIITMKEWPHVDVPERAGEILNAIENIINGQVNPVMSLWDCRMIGCYPTTHSPMSGLLIRMSQFEENKDVISVSLIHGFPYANNSDVGSKVLVITNNNPDLGASIAKNIGDLLWNIREEVVIKGHISIEQALNHVAKPYNKPLVLSDQADSVAGGAPGDSTFLLQAFLTANVKDIAFGPIWDPDSVEQCYKASKGDEILLKIGGKTGPESGSPVTLNVTICEYISDLTQKAMGEIPAMSFGKSVWVKAQNNIDIILHSNRAPVFYPTVIEDFGIDLSQKAIIICKMWRHGSVGFAPIAGEMKAVTSPGAQTLDFASIDYSAAPHGFWPQDSNPFH